MGYRIVDPASIDVGPGPHPAASPFDKRIGEALGLSAFALYQVELPPGEATVWHDHRDDQVEDVYIIIEGAGWVVVDDEEVPVRVGHVVSVSISSSRQVRAGREGVTLIAVCASTGGLA